MCWYAVRLTRLDAGTLYVWKRVSGGVIDGDEDHKFYRYGGMWKNKHAGVSAKNRKGKGKKEVREWQTPDEDSDGHVRAGVNYTQNDRVIQDGKTWVCRRSHESSKVKRPGDGWRWWKEAS